MVKMMSIVLVLVLGLAAVACGGDDDGDDGGAVTVESADTCEELVEAFMPIMQEVLDAVSEMSIADLMAEEDDLTVLDDFEERLDAVEAKSDELECESDEMATLLEARFDELTATGPVGELILELLREEGFD